MVFPLKLCGKQLIGRLFLDRFFKDCAFAKTVLDIVLAHMPTVHAIILPF